MIHVVDLKSGWSLWRDDASNPLLVHTDGRRVEPKAFVEMAIAEEMYVALKLEEDKISRTVEGHERTAEFMCIWSARAVLGYWIRQRKKELRILREKERPSIPDGDDGGPDMDGEVVDLKGNPVEIPMPQLVEEDPEEFLDRELDKLAKRQQEERAKLWEKQSYV